MTKVTKPVARATKYGWTPDLPDHRDFKYAVNLEAAATLPSAIDLRKTCPVVYDQGQLGSCTANAIGGALEFEQRKKKDPHEFMPSRLFIYYNERVMEGTVNSDAGAMIRDGIKSVSKQGVCHETKWPYVITKFKNKPTATCYTDGLKYKAISYSSVNQDLISLKTALAAGDVVVFGFTVYSSFESAAVAKNGIVPMPATTESVLGGHAVVAVGYDDSKNWFICRNSWGSSWGDKGYFYMPYEYLTNTNLASDFWVIKDVQI